MKKLKLGLKNMNEILTREQMKSIFGGFIGSGGSGNCMESECESDSDCANSKYGKNCKKSTCVSTGKAANYCCDGC